MGLIPLFGWSTAMDLSTHDLVIEKLENVLKSYHGELDEKWAISSRLADLYADRARLKFMAEQEKNCDSCLGSRQDREKALRVYREIFPQAQPEAQERILLQQAHLHQLNGQARQARRVYQSILDNPRRYSPSLRGQALTGLGEMDFRNSQFQQARRHFEAALQIADTPGRHFVEYRLAWSLLNLGEQRAATDRLVRLLRQPASGVPQSFYEDAARDLATFLARAPVTSASLQMLLDLSPQESQKSNLFYLATEADRLGQKSAAVAALQLYRQKFRLTAHEELDVQIRSTQLQLDLGKPSEALQNYAEAARLWGQLNCRRRAEECNEIQSRFRSFILTWHRVAKTRPPAHLSQAYEIYTATFPQDADMIYRSAQLAHHLKNHDLAVKTYRQASVLAHRQLRSRRSRPADIDLQQIQTIFEGALLGEIEAAEASKNKSFKSAAYDHYLNLNSNGKHSHKVRYQRAQLNYSMAQYRVAADQFREVALNSQSGSYQSLAADLALDALALLKDNRNLQLWSQELAKALPAKAQEFNLIGFRALINESEQVINEKQPARRQSELLRRMKTSSPPNNSTNKDRQAFFKNRLLLGIELKDHQEILSAGQELIKIREVSQADKNLALAAMADSQEEQENYSSAYRWLSQMNVTRAQMYDHQMKLAHLAVLSSRSPRSHYQKAVDSTSNIRKKNEALAQLILLERNPWPMIRQNRGQLQRSPILFSNLVLESYGIRANRQEAETLLKNRALRNSEAGKALQRTLFHEDWRADFRPLINHKLTTSSDQQLQRSIQRRLDLIQGLEQRAQQALDRSDWTEQVVLVNLLNYEFDRFYRELINLPTPRGLNPTERAQYRQLLRDQAQVYRDQAQSSKEVLDGLWAQRQNLDRLAQEFRGANPNIRRLIRTELNLLKRLAPEATQNRIDQILAQPSQQPSRLEAQVRRPRNTREN